MSIERFTFDTFMVGDSNHFALAACKAIARHPQVEYNPLWLYGRSGCGKTHLLKATCHALRLAGAAEVLYMTAQDLVDIRLKSLSGEHRPFDAVRTASILVIDNVEYLCGRKRMQADITSMILDQCAGGRRVMMASNCPPSCLEVLSEWMLKRGEHGLIADVMLPELMLRTRFAERYLEQNSFTLETDVKEYLISTLTTIPLLEGALNTARFSGEQVGEKIDRKWAENYINQLEG